MCINTEYSRDCRVTPSGSMRLSIRNRLRPQGPGLSPESCNGVKSQFSHAPMMDFTPHQQEDLNVAWLTQLDLGTLKNHT